MWPVVAIAAATAITQYLNSEQARKLNTAERQKLEGMLNKIQNPEYQNYPELAFSDFTPEDFQVLQQYVPEVAPYVAEANPTLVNDSAQGVEGRNSQLNAMRQLSMIAQSGNDPAMMADMDAASRRAQEESQSRTNTLEQQFERRGMLGSGLQASLEQQGAAQAMDSLGMQNEQAAADAYKRRLQALTQSADLGAQVVNQDRAMNTTNAGIINQFNQRTAANAQNWANNAANTRNSGQKFNIEQNQDIANKNTVLANQQNQDWRNYMTDATKYNNDMAQRGFQDEMDKARAYAGITSMARQDNTQNAQDQNQAIQGIGNAAASVYGYNTNKKKNDEE